MYPITNDSKTLCGLFSASGRVPYPLTNDYMFRAILQTNNTVLKGLISALLHLKESEITSVTIKNPIELGKMIQDKNFQLDILVLLNDTSVINLEMQVINKGNWIERSLSYLCRTYDNLKTGADYRNIKAAVHICFLDFSLPELTPEFYASYYLTNEKNHERYSDKLRLSIVNLKQIKLATDEDKIYHINDWAALFKAETWEEVKMIAEKNSLLYEASKAFYELSADEKIRQQCEARLDYERTHAHIFQTLQEQEEQLKEQKKMLKKKNSQLHQQASALLQKDKEIALLKAELTKTTKTKNTL